ncbi:MAG TPA: hydrogenase formation protein HypD [Clostridiales bacterium]|nr:hydrogenase formation protein HypD [Clostridiales bacterium]
MTLEQVKQELLGYEGRPIKIMEVCGTHTASIFKNGIRSLLPPGIQLISGPGCPVCVTSSAYIDHLVQYASRENYCILTFGDMMKVKGSRMSLTEAKAAGAKVQVLYSPLTAIKMALEHRATNYIFAAVGFETTAPIYALMMEAIIENNIKNLQLMTSIKSILPALTFLCDNEKEIDAFLCPGHVSVITGSSIYQELSERYRKPFVIAGFEGGHILAAVYEILQQLLRGRPGVKNLYTSAVSEEGNQRAVQLIRRYFEPAPDYWRGIGSLEASGLRLKQEYGSYDAGSSFETREEPLPKGCKCTDVILGRIHPVACPLFRKVCTPMNAVGPCMVSTEGACGIWFKNGN